MTLVRSHFCKPATAQVIHFLPPRREDTPFLGDTDGAALPRAPGGLPRAAAEAATLPPKPLTFVVLRCKVANVEALSKRE